MNASMSLFGDVDTAERRIGRRRPVIVASTRGEQAEFSSQGSVVVRGLAGCGLRGRPRSREAGTCQFRNHVVESADSRMSNDCEATSLTDAPYRVLRASDVFGDVEWPSPADQPPEGVCDVLSVPCCNKCPGNMASAHRSAFRKREYVFKRDVVPGIAERVDHRMGASQSRFTQIQEVGTEVSIVGPYVVAEHVYVLSVRCDGGKLDGGNDSQSGASCGIKRFLKALHRVVVGDGENRKPSLDG